MPILTPHRRMSRWYRPGARPLVLGHRGASRDAPENTLAAFALALAQGADGVELDVWRCGSGDIVVFHDEDGMRLGGSPVRITRAPREELLRLDVGAHKGERFRGGRIPLLGEVLEAFSSALLNIELKSSGIGDPRLALGVARLLARHGAAERVLVSSFDPLLLAAFRLAAPHVSTGLLFESGQLRRAQLARHLLHPLALHPDRALVTAERARGWQDQGYALNVWTVDDPLEVERLCSLGVAALISNVPGETREAVRRVTRS